MVQRWNGTPIVPDVVMWGGGAGLLVVAAASEWGPAPPEAVAAALVVLVAGFAFKASGDRRVSRRLAEGPRVARGRTPSGFRVRGGWPLAFQGAVRTTLWLCVLAAFVALWGMRGDGQPSVGKGNPPFGFLGFPVAVYVYYRYQTSGLRKVAEKIDAGQARALPVVVADRFGRLPGAAGRFEDAAPGHLVPTTSGALCLVSPSGGRGFLCDVPTDPLIVSDALAGCEGWLYWSTYVGSDNRYLTHAVLVLGDGRYLLGTTQRVGSPEGVPAESGAYRQTVRPVELSVLRAQSRFTPRVYLYGVAGVLMASALLGLWGRSRRERVDRDPGGRFRTRHRRSLFAAVGPSQDRPAAPHRRAVRAAPATTGAGTETAPEGRTARRVRRLSPRGHLGWWADLGFRARPGRRAHPLRRASRRRLVHAARLGPSLTLPDHR